MYIYKMVDILDDEWQFYKFRYTFKVDENPRSKFHLLGLLIGDTDEYYASAGIEKLNKLNETTHTHIHIHFALKNGRTLGAIRKAFQRFRGSDDETRKGNELYSLVEEPDVKEMNRFFRYAWKQGGRVGKDNGFREKLPVGLEVELEIALAIEEQKRMWEFNIKKRDTSLKPNTKDKLFEFLNTKFEDKKPSELELLTAICDYYNGEDKSANQSTCMGFLQTAMWKFGLETTGQTAERWLSKK